MPVVETCALCLNDRELCRSHIVPEFAYTPIYDDKHQYRLIGQGRTQVEMLQKGIREKLLCDECEARFQKLEDYFARYWYHPNPLPTPIPSDGVVLDDLNYEKLKLLLLSIIWRASVATGRTFEGVSLGPHQEKIRKVLLNENPGPSNQYRIFAGLIVDDDCRELWDHVVLAPLRIRILDLWAYRLVLGGVSWTVVISGFGSLPIDVFLLTESGRLVLPAILWTEFADASGLVDAASEIGKLSDNAKS